MRMPDLLLSSSSSRTGLNINGGGSPRSSTGRSSPYFLKKSRHSVQSSALSLPAWCQSLDSVKKELSICTERIEAQMIRFICVEMDI